MFLAVGKWISRATWRHRQTPFFTGGVMDLVCSDFLDLQMLFGEVSSASALCFQAFQHGGAQVVLRHHWLRYQQEGGACEDGGRERQGVPEGLHLWHGEWRSVSALRYCPPQPAGSAEVLIIRVWRWNMYLVGSGLQSWPSAPVSCH